MQSVQVERDQTLLPTLTLRCHDSVSHNERCVSKMQGSLCEFLLFSKLKNPWGLLHGVCAFP